MSGSRAASVCAVALLLVGAFAVAPNAVAATPRLDAYVTQIDRGDVAGFAARGLEPDTDYAVSTTVGRTEIDGAPGGGVRTDADGTAYFAVRVGSDVGLDVTAADVTIGTGTDAVTAHIPISAPRLAAVYSWTTCPGKPFTFGSGSWPDDDYRIDGAGLDPASSTVPARDGELQLGTLALADSLPATSEVTLTGVNSGVRLTFSIVRSAPEAYRYSWSALLPWHESVKITCLRPGEAVTLSPGARGLVRERSVRANADGTVYVKVSHLPTTAPSDAPGIGFRGESSGQTGSTAPVRTFGTTFYPGGILDRHNRGLLSADGRWSLSDYLCDLVVEGGDGFDVQARTWRASPVKTKRDDCYATVQNDGNFVLRRGDGSVRWTSRTNGTGAHNRLGMRNDGNLVLYGPSGSAVWSSRTGLIRTPAAMGAGQRLRAGQSLVNGSTRLTMRSSGSLVVTRAGRTLWSSHTDGRGVYAELLHDGRLVVRDRAGHAAWKTSERTYGFTVQVWVYHTGDVVVRDAIGQRLWHSNTG